MDAAREHVSITPWSSWVTSHICRSRNVGAAKVAMFAAAFSQARKYYRMQGGLPARLTAKGSRYCAEGIVGACKAPNADLRRE